VKKLFLVLLILAVFAGSVFAFEFLSYPPPVSGGNVMVDTGIGFVYTGYNRGKFGIPPLFLQVEYALPVVVPISVGAGVSFYQWKYPIHGDTLKETFVTPAFRANWHWGFDVSWLDFYTGAWFGYTIWNLKSSNSFWDYLAVGSSGLDWGFQAGVHFYFSNTIGVMVETGYPYLIKAGLTIKF
jgi:hypothetical protein